MLIRMKKSQSTLEYALLIAVVVGAFLGMQVYVKRGIQGRLKATADDMGEQYSPGETIGTLQVSVDTESTETLANGITTTTSTTAQLRTEDVDISKYSKEYWGLPTPTDGTD